jgi:Tfp pilus tip-associated adhesin PilY1
VGPSLVDPDDVREARTNRANHQNNVLFSTSVEIPGFVGHFTAHNVYRVIDPLNARTARQADFTKIWDAGELLQLRTPDSRNILFNKRGQTTLLPFDSSNVSAADLGVTGSSGAVTTNYLYNIDGRGAQSANDARDMVIGVVRGYRLSKHPVTGTLYNTGGGINFDVLDKNGQPNWKLFDAIAAPAVVGSPPRSPDFDPPQNHADKYGVGGTQVGDGFYWDHFNRRTMVYLPTNGGMLHGFDGETGDEVFAYIPDDAMGLAPGEVAGSRDILAEFVELVVAENNGIQNHQFTMSGAPSVKDAFLRSDFTGDDEWHTILSFGRGRGGRFLSALDVTDPQNPELRFNIGNREGINETDTRLDGLGETWSIPVMGNVQTDNPLADPDRADQWLAFFGAGFGCNNAQKEGHYLFAVRVENGTVYHRSQVTNDSTAAVPYNAVVTMPTLYNPHQSDVADNKDYVTRAYVGDVQGVIWKLVTTDFNPNNWTFRKFAELGKNQPITAPIALMDDPNSQQVYVMAGTGGDLRASSATNTFKFATFIDQDPDGANTSQYPVGSSPFWSKNLNPGERVYISPVTIGTVENTATPLVFFAASQPGFDNATCTGFFNSSLFALGLLSGQAEVDLDGGGPDESLAIANSKITGLYAREGQLYVSKSGGLGSGSGNVTVYGDGDFSDDVGTGGSGLTIQVLVDGFRISPF